MGISVSQPFAVISALWGPAHVSWHPRASTLARHHLHVFCEGPDSKDSRLRATVCGLPLLSSAGEPACRRPSTHNAERVWMCSRETWLAAEDPAWGRSVQPCLGACVQTNCCATSSRRRPFRFAPPKGWKSEHVCASQLTQRTWPPPSTAACAHSVRAPPAPGPHPLMRFRSLLCTLPVLQLYVSGFVRDLLFFRLASFTRQTYFETRPCCSTCPTSCLCIAVGRPHLSFNEHVGCFSVGLSQEKLQ